MLEKLESPKKQELPRDEAAAAFWHMRSMLQKSKGQSVFHVQDI